MMTITVSDAALIVLQELHGRVEGYLRLTTHTKGCAGLRYDLLLTDSIDDNDQEVKFGTFSLYLDGDRFMYFNGIHIDHVDDIEGRRFVFTNESLHTCGCGNSFRVGDFG